jgi:transposase
LALFAGELGITLPETKDSDVEDARFTYACARIVKTAAKPAQPIEKSTAGVSLLAQVIVAKYADHLPYIRRRIC